MKVSFDWRAGVAVLVAVLVAAGAFYLKMDEVAGVALGLALGMAVKFGLAELVLPTKAGK